ncbi:repeat protein [Cotonvirus japonicus]|uniref:Repeat protein n=1 Tax=Cotonvirus japonicus TaxID=2811091 RepID=A0ABM7NTT5_9VIRU|nr:repeat protein [Cotonvirus japonicus]BCS83526.1 repeat protein [Cotonvirus japonicus]
MGSYQSREKCVSLGDLLFRAKDEKYEISIQDFIQKNPDKINDICIVSFTALMYTSCGSNDYDYYNIVKILLDHGANTNIQEIMGNNTALMLAVVNNYKYDNLKIIDLLIKSGAKINMINRNGESALMLACKYNSSLELVQLLIDNGAIVNLSDKNGKKALEFARENKESYSNNMKKIIKLLENYTIKN